MLTKEPEYLQPYLSAAQKHGAGFGSLLWASPNTQRARFAALARAVDFNGLTMLDAGCGRADLFDYLLSRDVHPAKYIGLEAVDCLADAAYDHLPAPHEIHQADFVRKAAALNRGADVIVFCGSLNTFDTQLFYRCIVNAFEVASQGVVLNFLASTALAAGAHLNWHSVQSVLAFAGKLSPRVSLWEDYLPGDATVLLRKGAAL